MYFLLVSLRFSKIFLFIYFCLFHSPSWIFLCGWCPFVLFYSTKFFQPAIGSIYLVLYSCLFFLGSSPSSFSFSYILVSFLLFLDISLIYSLSLAFWFCLSGPAIWGLKSLGLPVWVRLRLIFLFLGSLWDILRCPLGCLSRISVWIRPEPFIIWEQR